MQVIRKGEAIPFDVAGTRTIHVDHKDLDSVESAKNEIVEQIRSLEKDSSGIETPISVSLDLQILRQSEKPEERSLADLVAAVADARNSLSSIEARLGTTEQNGMLDEIQSEMRMMPRKVHDLLEHPRFPGLRRGRFHPGMLREMVSMGPPLPAAFGVLVVAGLFKDIMPWLYELGVEVFRTSKHGTGVQTDRAALEFRQAVEFSIHGPFSRELFGRSKEAYFLREEIEPLLDRAIEMLKGERDQARRASRKD